MKSLIGAVCISALVGFAAGRASVPESFLDMQSDSVLQNTRVHNVVLKAENVQRVSIIGNYVQRDWDYSLLETASSYIFPRTSCLVKIDGKCRGNDGDQK